jgi:hypothetical protein
MVWLGGKGYGLTATCALDKQAIHSSHEGWLYPIALQGSEI